MGRVGAALALHELLERTRDRWVLVVSVLFALLASAVSLYGGRGEDATVALTGPSLVTLASLFVPLVALVLSHDAVVGERERNTLGLLLSLPVGRMEAVGAKFAGRAGALVLAVVVGLGAAIVADRSGSREALLRLVVPTVLLGLSFLSVGMLASTVARRQVTAASLVVVVWFLLVFFYDLGLLALLVASDGALRSTCSRVERLHRGRRGLVPGHVTSSTPSHLRLSHETGTVRGSSRGVARLPGTALWHPTRVVPAVRSVIAMVGLVLASAGCGRVGYGGPLGSERDGGVGSEDGPASGSDGAADARAADAPMTDAGAADAGPDGECPTECVCESRCAPDCACNDGCPCTLVCAAVCNPVCDGAMCEVLGALSGEVGLTCRDGATCRLEADTSVDVAATCTSGSTCIVDCRNVTNCGPITCDESSLCEVDCSGALSCAVSCEGGAECALTCGLGICGFSSCTGGEMSCPDGVRVCNRACP